MPETTRLKIALLIHDLKAPLAVIDLGARFLKERQATYGHLTRDQKIASDHLLKQIERLRREVDSVLSGNRGAKNSTVEGIGGLLKRLVRGASRPEGAPLSMSAEANPPDVTRNLLIDIEARLHEIGETVGALENGAPPGVLTAQQARVFKRLKRSVKLALILIGNAKILAFPGAIKNQPKSVRLGDAIRRPLVEVFDLYDWLIADQVENFTAVEDLTDLVAKAGLTLQIESGLLDRQFFLDKDKFGQVLVNLLLNAFKFRRETVWLSIKALDPHLVFSVSDDGRGILADGLRPTREERFVAGPDTDFPIRSHGIGLAGARLLTEEMGGELTIKSTRGKGTKILVTFPCMQDRRLKAED